MAVEAMAVAMTAAVTSGSGGRRWHTVALIKAATTAVGDSSVTVTVMTAVMAAMVT